MTTQPADEMQEAHSPTELLAAHSGGCSVHVQQWADAAIVKAPTGTRIILLRHAMSEGNHAKIMQGAGEYPLSAQGRLSAVNAAGVFAQLRAQLVASYDLSRAVETALLVAGRVDVTDERLRERGVGPWEGRTWAELEAAHPGSSEDHTKRPDTFEPVESVVARMRSACEELLAHGGLVAAFTHGSVLRLLEESLGGVGGRFSNLEGLCLDARLTPVGRIGPLDKPGSH